MTPNRAIRFGVREGDRRAATWKLWSEKTGNDVYLTSRALGGSLKVSLHASGQWHFAYTSNTFENVVKPSKLDQNRRFIETWQRPEPILPGVTLALRIITPHSAVNNPVIERKKSIVWLPNCSAGKATEIYILITSPTIELQGWPAQNSGSKLIGSYELTNGEIIWAVYLEIPMPAYPNQKGIIPQFFPGKTMADIRTGITRGMAFNRESDGSFSIHDFAVVNKSAGRN